MPVLCVLRHAKSDWATGAADHDRPLARRGREAAPLVGRWLRDRGYLPRLVLCSSARRTVDTLAALGDIGDPEVEVAADLYLAGVRQWTQRLRQVPDNVSPVLAVGHNPGLQQLVLALAAEGQERTQVAGAFPTAALAVLEIADPWARLGTEPARLAAFVRPRELA